MYFVGMWEEFIETTHETQRMDYVQRYSSIPITIPESVSTHSYWVAMYSAMIHQLLNPNDTVTLCACVMQALVHDTPESQVGDFVRTFKYRTKALKQAIDEAENCIIDEFGPSLKALLNVSSTLSKECGHSDYVKSVVKAADFMSLHNYMVRELVRGNREIIPFYDRMISDLKEMEKSNIGTTFKTGGLDFEPSMFFSELAAHASRVRGEVV
jgi:5'-deoxynucleotidase YfbR-like HD superfamily hydrolase